MPCSQHELLPSLDLRAGATSSLAAIALYVLPLAPTTACGQAHTTTGHIGVTGYGNEVQQYGDSYLSYPNNSNPEVFPYRPVVVGSDEFGTYSVNASNATIDLTVSGPRAVGAALSDTLTFSVDGDVGRIERLWFELTITVNDVLGRYLSQFGGGAGENLQRGGPGQFLTSSFGSPRRAPLWNISSSEIGQQYSRVVDFLVQDGSVIDIAAGVNLQGSGSLAVEADVTLSADVVAFRGEPLPAGVSYTSASGFFNDGVPLEPPTKNHIIVLSHGFSPGNDPSSDPNYLIDGLQPAIEQMLAEAGVDEGSYRIIARTWDEAYVPSLPQEFEARGVDGDTVRNLLKLPPQVLPSALGPPTVAALSAFGDSYNEAYGATEIEGKRLAADIQQARSELTNGAGPPTIHLIGHSLGSVVNAEAVRELSAAGIAVELKTILDSPKKASQRDVQSLLNAGISIKQQRVASFDQAILFYSAMPRGSVQFVENFFGGDEIGTLTPAFGQPIAGTVPATGDALYGRFFPDADHTEVWADRYRNIVLGRGEDSWVTPALYGSFNATDAYGTAALWNPDRPLNALIQSYNNSGVFNALLNWVSINPVIGDSSRTDRVQRRLGTVLFEGDRVRAVSNSPSSFSIFTDIEDVVGVEFSYAIEGATEGIVTLEFAGESIWELDLSEIGASLADTVYVSTFDFNGTGDLLWTYDSDTLGSSAVFSDFSLLVVIPVPEPCGLAGGILVACAVLAFRDRGSDARESSHRRR